MYENPELIDTNRKLKLIFEGGVKGLKIGILFSGGKDSLVLLDLCRNYRDKFSLIWIDTGYAFPHISEHIRKCAKGYELRIIKHDPISRWFRDGLPTSVLPMDNWSGATSAPKFPKLQPWKVCCSRRIDDNIGLLSSYGFNVLLSGQRQADAHGSLEHQILPNMMVYAPLWAWSDTNIASHVKEHSLELPEHCDSGDTSLECAICPAQMSQNRAALIKTKQPTLWPQVKALVNVTTEAALTELSAIRETM